VLRFKVDGDLPPVLASQARITGRIVQFPAQDALAIEHFLSAVRQSGLVAQDVEIRKADLEDVFLDVMQKHSGRAEPVGVVV
jgi:ABC-2 type transport system ATP-binding protein